MRILIWVITHQPQQSFFELPPPAKKKNCEYLSNPFFCRWDSHHSATRSFSIIPLQQKQNAEEITCRFTFQVSKHEIVRGPRKTRTKMIRNKLKELVETHNYKIKRAHKRCTYPTRTRHIFQHRNFSLSPLAFKPEKSHLDVNDPLALSQSRLVSSCKRVRVCNSNIKSE